MSLSKLTFLKTLTTPRLPHLHSPPLLRFLSFATPEEAAADRRRRKRELRIQPPLNSLRHQPQSQRRPQTPINNPNTPKLPDHVSALSGKRLDLHNRILNLIRLNDLDEASLLTRHSIYSNCKPTIYTCNSVMGALLRQCRYTDMLTLHRFVTQAGVAANVVTHNLLISAYCDCRKTDTALEHYKQLVSNAPFSPSPTTYRILTKALVENGKVERAVELKDEMLEKGLAADPIVYNYLMYGFVKIGERENGDKAVAVFEELREKLGFVSDGVVYGSLMKAYFLKGMEKEAMALYEDAVGEGSRIKMGAVAYNYVLQALIQNGKFDEAVKLFERMMGEHNPPRKLTVNLGSFNVMAEGYCGERRFEEGIEVFRKMGEKRCSPDTLSVNNLIEQLCVNDKVAEAEEVYRGMGDGANPDEYTYILLIEACFGQDRADDAAGYFRKMVETGLKPNLNAYNKVVDGLIKAGKVGEANVIFSDMIAKLKMEAANFEVMLRALCDANKLDEALKLVKEMLNDEKVGLSAEMSEFVKDALRKEEREEDLAKVLEEKKREDKEKAEALAKKAEEDRAAAAAKEAAKASAISAGTLSLFSRTKVDKGSATIDNQQGTDQAVPINASSTVDTTEEGVIVNGFDEELKTSDDAVVQEGTIEAVSEDPGSAFGVDEVAIEVNDLNKESKTSDDGVVEEETIEAVSEDAGPAFGVDKEAIEINDFNKESMTSDGVVEQTTVY